MASEEEFRALKCCHNPWGCLGKGVRKSLKISSRTSHAIKRILPALDKFYLSILHLVRPQVVKVCCEERTVTHSLKLAYINLAFFGLSVSNPAIMELSIIQPAIKRRTLSSRLGVTSSGGLFSNEGGSTIYPRKETPVAQE